MTRRALTVCAFIAQAAGFALFMACISAPFWLAIIATQPAPAPLYFTGS